MAHAPLLADAVDALYAAAPAEFVRTRSELASAAMSAGDKELASAVRALRKPTAAAHLVNRLTREDPAGLTDLRDLGERLRDAQARLDGAALKILAAERGDLVRRLTAACASEESPATKEQVAATLTAALADPHAQVAVDSGALVAAISYSGFGEVDLSGAIAAPLRLIHGGRNGDSPSANPGPSARDEERRTAQQEAARRAAIARTARARTALERADDAVRSAQHSMDEAQGRLARAERDLQAARDASAQAQVAQHAARRSLAAEVAVLD